MKTQRYCLPLEQGHCLLLSCPTSGPLHSLILDKVRHFKSTETLAILDGRSVLCTHCIVTSHYHGYCLLPILNIAQTWELGELLLLLTLSSRILALWWLGSGWRRVNDEVVDIVVIDFGTVVDCRIWNMTVHLMCSSTTALTLTLRWIHSFVCICVLRSMLWWAFGGLVILGYIGRLAGGGSWVLEDDFTPVNVWLIVIISSSYTSCIFWRRFRSGSCYSCWISSSIARWIHRFTPWCRLLLLLIEI